VCGPATIDALLTVGSLADGNVALARRRLSKPLVLTPAPDIKMTIAKCRDVDVNDIQSIK